MAIEDMIGGLKSALERGYSLEKGMISLFNARYKKEEIEEAARSLLDFRPEVKIQPIKTVPKVAEIKQVPQVLATLARPSQKLEIPVMQIPKPVVLVQQQSFPQKIIQLQKPIKIRRQRPIKIQKPIVQRVSRYGKPRLTGKLKERLEGRIIILMLFLLLIGLIGLLGVILIFKQQSVDFLNNILG